MAVLSKGSIFPTKVVEGMFNTVKGKSTLAKFAGQMPIAFTGNTIFTFSMDKDLAIVAENEAKEHGGVTVQPVTVQPIKLEYGARVSDEFMYASEEDRLAILQNFSEGFANKLAAAIDKMGMHGINPRTGSVSPLITTYIDKNATVVNQGSKSEAEALEDAVAALGNYDPTGIAVNKAFASKLAKSVTSGVKDYPDFKAWGSEASSINGVKADVNNTVGSTDLAIVGDFSAFKWGYAKDVTLEVIEYGDPDNTDVDLKGHNQVYLRAEVYVGVAVLDPAAFAVVQA